MKRSFTFTLLAALMLAALVYPAVMAQTSYIFTDLTPPSVVETMAYAINQSGQVTGKVLMANGGPAYAFRWTASTPNDTSGQLAQLGGTSSWAIGYSINNLGAVAGTGQKQSNAYQHALYWDASGGFYEIGKGKTLSAAYGLNDYGQIVTDESGFTLYQNGKKYVIGGGTVRGINREGYAVGLGTVNNHAFRWVPNRNNGTSGTLLELGTLGGSMSRGDAINDWRQVVGSSATGALDASGRTIYHAFLWTAGGTDGVLTNPQMKDLDPLSLYGNSWAYAVNNLGQVVGVWRAAGVSSSFIWDSANGMRDLSALGTNLPPGFILTETKGINDAGQVVGYGQYNGYYHGFLLTPQ